MSAYNGDVAHCDRSDLKAPAWYLDPEASTLDRMVATTRRARERYERRKGRASLWARFLGFKRG